LDTKGLTLSPVITARAGTKRRSVWCQAGSAPAGLAQGARLAKSRGASDAIGPEGSIWIREPLVPECGSPLLRPPLQDQTEL